MTVPQNRRQMKMWRGNSRRRPRIQTLSPRIAVVRSSLPAVPVVKNGLKKIHGEQGAWETVKREA